MLENRADILWDRTMDKYCLAVKYKAGQRYPQTIELLKEAINDIKKEKNSIEEIHLLAILQDALIKTYIEMDEGEKDLSFLRKSITNIEIILENIEQSITATLNQALRLTDVSILYRIVEDFDTEELILLTEQSSILYLLYTKDNAKITIASISKKDKKLSIDIHQDILKNPPNFSQIEKLLDRDFSCLSNIVLKSIPKDTKKVYFSPFDDLNIIPFHFIPMGEDEYLIDRYEVDII